MSAGLVIDVARIYVAQRQLQTATDAAALAAAQDLPDGTTAVTTACTYSASDRGPAPATVRPAAPNGDNTVGSLDGVQTTTQLECLSVAAAGINCAVGDGCPSTVPLPPSYPSGGGCNAIKVTETANVSTTFMNVLGIEQLGRERIVRPRARRVERRTRSTSRWWSIRPGRCATTAAPSVPGIPDDEHATDQARLRRTPGIRALLSTLLPCALTTPTCLAAGDGLNVLNPIDRVGLMIFPAMYAHRARTPPTT